MDLDEELFIDRFLAARKPAAAPKPAVPAATAPAPAAAPAESDTGRLRLEVEAFMQRDALESNDDSEVQEYLKERSGFNPNDLE